MFGTTSGIQIPTAFNELWIPARHKAFHGGRGGAKSHSMAGALILQGSEKPMRVGCYREIQKSIKASVKQLLDDKIKEAGLGKVSNAWDKPQNGFYVSTEYGIKGGGGTTEFMFAGLRTNPESVKSTEGLDVAWVEEANTVSQRSIGLLTPTLRKNTSELWWSWNRRDVKDPVDNMFLGDPDNPPPRSIIRKVTHADNFWFPDTLREEMEWDKSRDYDKYLHVWEGEPIQRSDSKVFTNWAIDDIDDQVPEGCLPRYGADWGYSIDPTVLMECYVWDRTLYFRQEAYKVRCEIDDVPALFGGNCPHNDPTHIHHWANPNNHRGIDGAYRHEIVADSAYPQTINYLARHGFNIRGAVKGPKSVEEGVEFMKSYDIIVHPDCQHTIDELATYSYKVDPLTDAVTSVLKDRDNHVIDSARYALEGVRRRDRSTGVPLGDNVKLQQQLIGG